MASAERFEAASVLDWPAQAGAMVSEASGTVCVDVQATGWAAAVQAARDGGFTFFDWLTAVDEPQATPAGVDVVSHLVALHPLRRVLLRTRVAADAHAALTLPSITGVFPGAAWHERETFEMFGVEFTGFDDGTGIGLRPLLLPDGFEGTPLRKSFQLAARATRAWPGAKEPGESGESHAPSRRKSAPPGVPDPSWGPREPGQAPPPPAPTRPRRATPPGRSATRSVRPEDDDV
jgi:NADH-quinone oxidoreductase subunit C